MAGCRKTEKNTACTGTEGTSHPLFCDTFRVCLPFGQTLIYDGTCLRVEGLPDIEDGTYGRIVVENGCIVQALEDPPPVYIPPPCIPDPDPCGGGDGVVPLSTIPGNILFFDGVGALYGGVQVEGGTNTVFSGDGTPGNPLRVDVAGLPDFSTYLISGDQIIAVDGYGSASDPYIVSHRPNLGGTYGGFTFDSWGHLTGYTDPAAGIQSVIPGLGISAETAAGVVTVGLSPVTANTDTLICGGLELTFDIYGRLIQSQRVISTEAGVYRPDRLEVSVNEYGSITGATPISPTVDFKFSRQFSIPGSDAYIFTTGMTGRLRVKIQGFLGTSSLTDGFHQAPPPWSLSINSILIPLWIQVCGGQVVSAQALTTAEYPGAEYIVAWTAGTTEQLQGFFDFEVVG